MSMLAKWNLGGKALAVASWAADVARSIDPGAALAIAFKVIEIEQTRRGIGGDKKVGELIAWAGDQGYLSGNSETLILGFVRVLVALLNALGVFAK